MKRSYMECCSLYSLLLPVMLSVFFFSCDTYNFSHPQPVDKENIVQFPQEFCGNWIDDDSEQILINRNFIGMVINGQMNIVKGIWPKLNKDGKYNYLTPPYKSFSSIRFDSLEHPVDTLPNYVINNGHIYEFNEQGMPEQGYHFNTVADTIIVSKKDTFIIDLGHNAFLRSIDDEFWVMNVRNQVLAQENRWWQLFILEKKEKDKINIWYCSQGLTKSSSMFFNKRNNYYFNSSWTAADVIRLIKEGGFEMCNQLHRD
jgi:hypothetical protein